MNNNRIWLRISFLMLLHNFFVGYVSAQPIPVDVSPPIINFQPVNIEVEIDFGVTAISNHWKAEEKNKLIVSARQLLAELLKSEFQYWNFTVNDIEQECVIRLKVVDPNPEDGKHEAEVRLEILISGKKYSPISAYSWLDSIAINLTDYPTYQDMPQKLALILEEEFLKNRIVDIRKWLRDHIPLAESAQWLDEKKGFSNYDIVLALPYEDFKYLQISSFKMYGKRATGPLEELQAVGIGRSADFQAGSSPPYSGLVVSARKIRPSMLDEYRSIKPDDCKCRLVSPVFLLQETNDNGPIVAFFGEDGS